MKVAICLAVMLLVGAAHAQIASNSISTGATRDRATLTVQYDNRGSKTMSPSTDQKVRQALADKVFLVPVSQVRTAGGLGQSGLFNHQSVVIYQAVGPTTNGKTVLANCKANTKSGWFTSSAAKKAIKKGTDTWAIGDSLKLETASCK